MPVSVLVRVNKALGRELENVLYPTVNSDVLFTSFLTWCLVRVRLHQASVSMQRQRWDDACDTALIVINGATPKWVATLFE